MELNHLLERLSLNMYEEKLESIRLDDIIALDDLLIWNELLKEACVTNLAHHTRILRELKYEAEKQKIRIPIRPLLLKIQMG